MKEKNNTKKGNINKKKVLVFSIIIVIILLVIASAILYQRNKEFRSFLDTYIFRKKIYQNELVFIDIENTNNEYIYAYSNYIAILSDHELKLYNKYGNEEKKIEVKINQPIFESDGNILGIAENGGQNLYVLSGKNILWEKQVEGKISNISINKNGYVAVSILGTSYKTIVEMYNESGTELFKTFLSTSSVIDTAISNDNKYLAIAEANFSGTAVQSNIKIISINEALKEPAKSILYEYKAPLNDLIVNVCYNNKNSLLCMYDSYISRIENKENYEVTALSSEETLFTDINLSSTVIKVIKKSSGVFQTDAELKIINPETNKEINYEIEDIPKTLTVYGGNICLNLGSTALFISDNGWLIKEYNANQEIQKIVLGENLAGIIYNNKIEIICL